MAIRGKITQVLPMQTGVSKAGKVWSKQEYVLETEGTYPRKVCFAVMGENIRAFDITEGSNYEVEIDVESREYNGKWYHNVTAWKVTKI